jgi:hypothetical protein
MHYHKASHSYSQSLHVNAFPLQKTLSDHDFANIWDYLQFCRQKKHCVFIDKYKIPRWEIMAEHPKKLF